MYEKYEKEHSCLINKMNVDTIAIIQFIIKILSIARNKLGI